MSDMNNIASNSNLEKSVPIRRNSLIEFYRFLFAMWVVWFHSYFLFKDQHFGHGYIAVNFFFILSGFYLIKSIDKYKEMPFFKGITKFVVAKLKSLGWPLAISFVLAVWYMFLDTELTLFGFLWYIPFMFLSFVVIYIMRKYTLSNKKLIIFLIISVVLNYILYYNPFIEGIWLFGAVGGVSMGVLLSLVPKKELKLKTINFNWIITFVLFFVTIYLAYLPNPNLVREYIMVLLLIPLLIFFTNTVKVNCNFLNFLGSMSFGLYVYQCIIRIIDYYIPMKQYWLFIILLGIVLLDKLIEYIYKYYKFREKSKEI